ncbi:MAG: hypothetical protein L0332_29590 [Chloroflexi bacterium]|nr:hypothetical protein [Chloroflexota bacterium]MCI0578916.1 hypothetical protein [Chloroflexota bacterium]MCI0647543.1 hypothetical protein [Chloroflexota bacterium]MCI0730854.1 hypothetical protein [Chloroflexota bacterium]
MMALVFLAAIALGVVGAGVVRASGESVVPECSRAIFDASSGIYYVTCKPGDGATMMSAQTRKLANPAGSFITYEYAPQRVRIEFNDPGGACYRWTVTDSNGNTNARTQGYPNTIAPFCNN